MSDDVMKECILAMKNVERFDLDDGLNGIVPAIDGDFMYYDDYKQLEKENAKLMANIELYRHRSGTVGCSDSNCIFVDNSKKMHTNGGCQCEQSLRRQHGGFDACMTIRFLRNQLRRIKERKA